jgi:hypothetical protein
MLALHVIMAFLLLCGIVYVCTFKVMDRDFWWHITAGNIMLQRHELISVDPFAYTREGLPYLSNREWLAQILFSAIYGWGGSTGIILLRTLLVTIAFGAVLFVGFSAAWPLAPLLFWAAHLSRPSLMDRPQLFTFAFLGIILLLVVRSLNTGEHRGNSRWYWTACCAVIIQILWANMHGAAAIFGLIIPGAALFQFLVSAWIRNDAGIWRMARHTALLIVILTFVSLLSPETWHFFSDLWTLPSDRALWIVREWQPLAAGAYWKSFWIFWVVAFGSMALGRRNLVFWATLVLLTGLMSIQSFRHTVLFVLIASGAALDQWAHSNLQRHISALIGGPWKMFLLSIAGTAVVILLIGHWAYQSDSSVVRRQGLFGYGEEQICPDAADFIERTGFTGPMFNTYNLGSYLIYRGYPSRKVFLDGRNVEHGFERINGALLAAQRPGDWETLSEHYGFTYAVMDILLTPDGQQLSFQHLSGNKDWIPVFLDDVSVVYAKNIPQNASIIRRYGLRFVTPERLEFGTLWDVVPARNHVAAARELERLLFESKHNLKAAILLAQYERRQKRFDEANRILTGAQMLNDFRPEVYEQLGLLAIDRGEWGKAGRYFEEAIDRAGGSGPGVNYGFLSMVFERAGDFEKALRYGAMAPLPPER